MIGGIGEELGLQAEGVTIVVNRSPFSLGTSFQKIPGIQLYPRQSGASLQQNTRPGAPDPRKWPQCSLGTIDDPIVVIAGGVPQGGKILVDPCADGGGTAEVHGGAFYRSDFSGWEYFQGLREYKRKQTAGADGPGLPGTPVRPNWK